MIGQLPTSLDVGGVSYPIETDYRNILVFLAACSDPELSPAEKLEILMKRLYRDGFSQIPQEHLEEAILQAKWFVDCGQEDDDKKPARKVMDWGAGRTHFVPCHQQSGRNGDQSNPIYTLVDIFGIFYGD